MKTRNTDGTALEYNDGKAYAYGYGTDGRADAEIAMQEYCDKIKDGYDYYVNGATYYEPDDVWCAPVTVTKHIPRWAEMSYENKCLNVKQIKEAGCIFADDAITGYENDPDWYGFVLTEDDYDDFKKFFNK